MDIDIKKVENIIKEAVEEVLLPSYHHVQRQFKNDGSIVTAADTKMQSTITSALSKVYPDIALLGEEMPLEKQQALLNSDDSLWCLDPIDGTSNFAAGLPFFSVSLAYIKNGKTQLAIVYDPIRDESFTARLGQGAYLNGKKLHAKAVNLSMKQSIALIDFKRLPKPLAKRLVEELPFGSQRNLGSIALELCWIAAGRAHLYLHGSQHLWDFAAAHLILQEAGAFICSLSGKPLTVQSLSKRSACAAIDQRLFDDWFDYLKQ